MTAQNVRTTGRYAYRDFVIDGVASSGENEPNKLDSRSFVDATADAIGALEDNQTSGLLAFATWADLDAHDTSGLQDGSAAKVYDDAGTHEDPVTDETVDNEGVYSFVEGSPGGWERIANLEAEDAKAQADRAEDEADRAEAAFAAFSTEYPTTLNMFNPAAVREGYYVSNSTGAINAAAGWACSDFMPVVAGEQYTVASNTNRASEIGFYTSESDSANISGSSGSATLRTVTAPAGANFMVITVKSPSAAQPTAIMVNEGPDALPYEPWTAPLQALTEEALPPDVLAMFQGLEADVLTEVLADNLFDPAAVREGYYVLSGSGAVTGPAAGWACSDFMPVEAGASYTVSASGQRQSEIGFFTSAVNSGNIPAAAAGSTGTRTVVAPAGANFMVISVKSPTYAQPAWIMVNRGVSALPYSDYHPPRLAVRADAVVSETPSDDAPFGRLVLNGSGDVESWVESNRSGQIVRNTFVFDPIPAESLVAYPVKLNLRKVYLGPTLFRDGADDIAPDVFTDSGNIGANHGYLFGRGTSAAHGKTTDDEGSVWTKSSVEHVLIKVVDANTLLIARRATNSYPTTGAFTHVSGATNTGGFTVSAFTDLQWYPPHNGRAVTVIVDGLTVDSSGETSFEYERDVKIVETVNLLARSTIIEWWIANGGARAGVVPAGDPSVIETVTYYFDRDGQLSVYLEWLPLEDKALGYLRGLQVGLVGTPTSFYVPGSLPFTFNGDTVDYSLIEPSNLTVTAVADVLFGSTRLEATGEYGHRLYSLWADAVFATGFLPIADAAIADRRTNASNTALEIYRTGKVYFRTLDKGSATLPAGERHSVVGFRHIVPRTADRTAVVPVRTPSGVDYLYVDWHDKVGLDRIPVPPDFVGRSFTVADSRNIDLDDGILVGDLPVVLDVAGSYASLVLEVR